MDEDLAEFDAPGAEQVENQDPMVEDEPHVSEDLPKTLRFRNYHPKDPNFKSCMVAPPPDLLKPAIAHFEQTSQYQGDDVSHFALFSCSLSQSLLSLVPKTANWDLKRDLEPKMAQLERQTQVAINALLSMFVFKFVSDPF
jgi:hypothetical protein